MKKPNDIERIDELFRNGLENAEFDVPGNLWNAIESGIESQAHVAGQTGGVLAKGVLFKGAALLVAAGIAVGSYLYLSETDTNNKPAENNPATVQTAPDNSNPDSAARENTSVVIADPYNNPASRDDQAEPGKGGKEPAEGKTGPQKGYTAPGNSNDGLKSGGINENRQGDGEKKITPNNAQPKEETAKSSFWFTLSDTVICLGDAVVVNTYQDIKSLKWFIDGIQYYPPASSFSLRFDRAGFFDISMQSDDKKFSRRVYVESVSATFKVTYLDKGRFRFVSSSRAAKTLDWDFGDGTPVLHGNTVEHTFPASRNIANYKVVLTARGKASCSDTFGMDVQNRFTGKKYGAPQVPNAFSPNGDGTNDKLELSWDGDGPCVIVITDLKGFRVWESKDAVNQFWDGTHKDNGNRCPAGQYIATVSYRDQDSQVKTFNVVVYLTE